LNPSGATNQLERNKMQSQETFFARNGDIFSIEQEDTALRHSTLPAGTYLLRFSMEAGFFLELTDDMTVPKKIYGNLNYTANKILNTFHDRPKTTGVSLSGEKGSGKTLLTKLISQKAREDGIPTILVNMPASGDIFSNFLQKIDQPVIILFDEFEKVYEKPDQRRLLTLLDGVFSSKKLFLLTSNSYSSIDENMKNRPGRIYYYMEFKGLDGAFIEEYGRDNLKNQDHLSNLSALAGIVRPMNFDMLQAVIEECNRYDQAPIDSLEMLNVRISSFRDAFTATIHAPHRKNAKLYSQEFRVNPLEEFGIEIYYYDESETDKSKGYDGILEGTNNSVSIKVSPSDLVLMDGINGEYKYKFNDNNEHFDKSVVLHLKRKPIMDETMISSYRHLL
jgi:hypothetical protein